MDAWLLQLSMQVARLRVLRVNKPKTERAQQSSTRAELMQEVVQCAAVCSAYNHYTHKHDTERLLF